MVKKVRINSIFIVPIILIIFSTICISASYVEDSKFVGKVNTAVLNVRQGPGTEFDICTTLKKGDTVNVIRYSK